MPVTVAELIAKFGADTTGLVAGVASSKREVVSLDKAATEAGKNVKTALEGIGRSADDTAVKTTALGASVTRLKTQTDGLAVSKAKIAEVGGAIAKTAGYAAVAMSTLAIGAGKMAADFDQSMRNVDSIAHLTKAQFDSLSTSVLALSRDPAIKQSAGNLADGLYQIYSSGKSGKEALEILRVSAIGASAGMTDTATSTRVLMGVLNSGIGGVKSASQAMDVLFQEVNLGQNNFEELAQQIGPLLPLAAQSGISLQELSAAMAALTINGTDAAEAATQLQGLISHLVGASGEAAKEMDALGIAHGLTAVKAEGLTGALKNVMEKTRGHKDALHDLFPEIRSYIGLLALTGDGAKKYTDFLAGMNHANDGAGAAMDANKRQLAGVKAQYEQLSNTLQADLIPAGKRLLPIFKEMIPLIKDVADDVIALVDAFAGLPEPVQKTILALAAAQIASNTLGLRFAGLGGNALKLVGGFGGVKLAGAGVLDMFGVLATEGTATVAGLGLIGIAAAGLAGDFLLIKRDAEVAIDALKEFQRAKAGNEAADKQFAGLNHTGDQKRNMIGEAAKIANEIGNINQAIAGRRTAIKNLSGIGGDGDFAAYNAAQIAKAKADIAALTNSLHEQQAARKRLLEAANSTDYKTHSAAYNGMTAGDASGSSKRAAAQEEAQSSQSVKDAMAARSKAEKEAARQAKEAAAERKREAAEAARDAERRAEQARNYLGDMREEIALWGNESREAKLYYEIQHGGMDYLDTAAKRKRALDLAATLDRKKEIDDERERLHTFLEPNKAKADEYRQVVDLGTNATDRQTLAWEHAHTVIDTLTEADQAFIRKAWASAEVWADRAQKTTLAADALSAMLTIQQGYATSTRAQLGGVKTAAQEAADAIRSALDPSRKSGFDIGSPELSAAQAGVMSAAIGADTQHASTIAKKWLDELSAQADQASEKVGGTFTPATRAVDAWLKTNHAAIEEMSALIGDEKALTVVSTMKAAVGALGNLTAANTQLEAYKSKIADITKQYQTLSASSPFEAWKQSISEYNKATGTTGAPFGDDDLKRLFNYEQGLKAIGDVSKGVTDALFSSVGSLFGSTQDKQQQQDYLDNLKQQRYSVAIQSANFNTGTGVPNPYAAQLTSIDNRISQTQGKLKGMGVTLQGVFHTVFGGIIQEFDTLIAQIAENALKADLQSALSGALSHILGKPLSASGSDKLIAAENAQLVAITANTAKMNELIGALNTAASVSTAGAPAAGIGGTSGFLGVLGSVAGLIPGGSGIAQGLGIASSIFGSIGGKSASSSSGLYSAPASGGYTTSDGKFQTSGVSYQGGYNPATHVTMNITTPDITSFQQSSGQLAQQAAQAAARAQTRNGK